jgi:hypothetical protein
MTKAEREYLSRVADLGCILCKHLGYEGTPAEIHHIRTGTGAGRRASHYDTLPLCPEHHRGQTGLHGLGTKGFAKKYQLTELDLLAQVKDLLHV